MFSKLATSVLTLFFIFTHTSAVLASNSCHYTTWTWDASLGKAINHRTIKKNRSQLIPSERDPHSSCTVCEEDQVVVRIDGIAPFKICRYFSEQIKKAILTSLKNGFPIYEVIGYRVGKTKGAVDQFGYRTKFSHHSFGSAIDINSKFNGLYDECETFSKRCRLLRGGVWDTKNPASIKRDSVLYEEFRKIGWRWGGEIKGRQKDFMHFSITGD